MNTITKENQITACRLAFQLSKYFKKKLPKMRFSLLKTGRDFLVLKLVHADNPGEHEGFCVLINHKLHYNLILKKGSNYKEAKSFVGSMNTWNFIANIRQYLFDQFGVNPNTGRSIRLERVVNRVKKEVLERL